MTPRMYERLRACAAVSAEASRFDLPEFTEGVPETDRLLLYMNHVPPNLREEVYKPFAHGFNDCLYAISDVLNSSRAPTVENVTRAWVRGVGQRRYDQRYREHYINKGGKVEYAIAAVLWTSQQGHETLGDGDCLETAGFRSAVEALP
ncbi:hypothetical protein B484DRAFT_410268, partial [Ochromonadaceae sp. CCMP2298]